MKEVFPVVEDLTKKEVVFEDEKSAQEFCYLQHAIKSNINSRGVRLGNSLSIRKKTMIYNSLEEYIDQNKSVVQKDLDTIQQKIDMLENGFSINLERLHQDGTFKQCLSYLDGTVNEEGNILKSNYKYNSRLGKLYKGEPLEEIEKEFIIERQQEAYVVYQNLVQARDKMLSLLKEQNVIDEKHPNFVDNQKSKPSMQPELFSEEELSGQPELFSQQTNNECSDEVLEKQT